MAFSGLRRFFRLDRAADVDRAVNDELEFGGALQRDPRILGTVALGLLALAALASLVPALRASRVDPNVALRAE